MAFLEFCILHKGWKVNPSSVHHLSPLASFMCSSRESTPENASILNLLLKHGAKIGSKVMPTIGLFASPWVLRACLRSGAINAVQILNGNLKEALHITPDPSLAWPWARQALSNALVLCLVVVETMVVALKESVVNLLYRYCQSNLYLDPEGVPAFRILRNKETLGVSSLQILTRAKVRHVIASANDGLVTRKSIEDLEIPEVLKAFIMLSDITEEKLEAFEALAKLND